MKTIALPSTLGLLLVGCLLAASTAANASYWVSNTGSDSNPCSFVSPCRFLQKAHDVAIGGDSIRCLDSSDFGSVAITKSLIIDCRGHSASSFGVTVNAPANATVTIRGLGIDAFGTSRGIHFIAGSTLHVEDCMISGYIEGGDPRAGIYFNPSAASQLFVTDTVISNNGNSNNGGGIVVHPLGGGSAFVALNRVTLNQNSYGIFAQGLSSTGPIVVEVRDSSVSGSLFHGIFAITDASQAAIVVDRTLSSLNAGSGIMAQGAGALVHISNSTVRGNGVGLSVTGGGQILSAQNNLVVGNGVDGAPTGVLTLK